MIGPDDTANETDVGPAAPFRVRLAGAERDFACRPDQSLLAAMISAGLRGLPVGCRSGGCGVCRVRVLTGAFRCGAMSRAAVSLADESVGLALACRVYPLADLVIEPSPRACAARPELGQAA